MSINKYIESDFRSLALHKIAVAKVRANPELFDKIKHTNTHFGKVYSPSSMTYYREWNKLIETGLGAVLDMALATTEFAATMRSTSPFSGILTEDERLAFLHDWKLKRKQKAA